MCCGFVFDMDGVLYRNGALVGGAVQFVRQLLAKHVPFRFLIDHAERTQRQNIDMLRRLGFAIEPRHLMAGTDCKMELMQTAGMQMDLAPSETILVSDDLEGDLRAGVRLGFKTVLVLTGDTQRSDLSTFSFQPDHVVDSIADLKLEHLDGLGLCPDHVGPNGSDQASKASLRQSA